MSDDYPRRLGSLDPPATVREIVARLEREGFETWCVGGAVRDALLGHPHLDWDLATAATPTQVMRIFRRTIPVGVEFGTVGVLDSGDVMHEVTTFRRDVRTDGRHAVVEFGVSLNDDLARRDFTINAIAYHPKQDALRDPFEGQLDLQRGIVRAVGVAVDRMREDRLRALRGIRFAARFGFHIEPATLRAIEESAPFLTQLSPERVKQELEKTMRQAEQPSVALEWWRSTGALRVLVPAIASAPEERFLALDHLAVPARDDPQGATLNRLTMLFFGETAAATAAAAKALKFSNADTKWMTQLAEAYRAIGREVDDALRRDVPDRATVRRWVARVGRTRTPAFFTLTAALWRARLTLVPDVAVESRLAPLTAAAADVAFRDPVELADLAVDGEDLRSVGVGPGPRVGVILQALLARVIAEPAENSRDHLLDLAVRFANTRPL